MKTIESLNEIKGFVEEVDAVIFDLDDTLYNEKDYVISGYKAIAAEFPEITDCARRLTEAFIAGEKPIDKVLSENNLFSETNKSRALERYRKHYPDIGINPETTELIQQLKHDGKKLGIITDGRPEGQRAKIAALGIEDYFDEIIITDEFGGPEFRKPNPLAFKLMSETLRVPYERMLYIGDNISKDFIAPEQLGMKYIHYINRDGLYYCDDGKE